MSPTLSCPCPNPRGQHCWRDQALVDAAARLLESALRRGGVLPADVAERWLAERDRRCAHPEVRS
jgi:hypothetical protein